MRTAAYSSLSRVLLRQHGERHAEDQTAEGEGRRNQRRLVHVEGVKQHEDKIDEVWIVQSAALVGEHRLVGIWPSVAFTKLTK